MYWKSKAKHSYLSMKKTKFREKQEFKFLTTLFYKNWCTELQSWSRGQNGTAQQHCLQVWAVWQKKETEQQVFQQSQREPFSQYYVNMCNIKGFDYCCSRSPGHDGEPTDGTGQGPGHQPVQQPQDRGPHPPLAGGGAPRTCTSLKRSSVSVQVLVDHTGRLNQIIAISVMELVHFQTAPGSGSGRRQGSLFMLKIVSPPLFGNNIFRSNG